MVFFLRFSHILTWCWLPPHSGSWCWMSGTGSWQVVGWVENVLLPPTWCILSAAIGEQFNQFAINAIKQQTCKSSETFPNLKHIEPLCTQNLAFYSNNKQQNSCRIRLMTTFFSTIGGNSQKKSMKFSQVFMKLLLKSSILSNTESRVAEIIYELFNHRENVKPGYFILPSVIILLFLDQRLI